MDTFESKATQPTSASYSDQKAFFDPATWTWPVHLIGAGGINNSVGSVLAKMGIREIHIWDDDVLEERNCPTEVAYSYRMAGNYKIDAMADAIRYLMETNPHCRLGTHMDVPVGTPGCTHCFDIGDNLLRVYAHYGRVTANTQLSGVVISGVDSMASRKVIWQAVQQNFIDVPLYIDGRSAGEDTAIFAFSPANFEDAAIYEESWLFDDAEASPLPCGARNIGYISAYMASEIARIITRFHRNLPIEFYTPHDFS